MRYERNEQLEMETLQRYLGDSRDEREHPTLTDLIYCLTKASYLERIQKEGRVWYPSRRTMLFFVLGLGLEQALLRERGGKLSGILDGIPYHLDDFDDEGLMELKTTRARPNPEEPYLSEGWLKQIMGYCKTQGLTEINFVVLHLIQPEIQAWRLSFDQEEIDGNWEWLLERKKTYDHFKEKGEYPTPYEYRMEWECNGCDFATFCEAVSARKA